MVDRPIIFSAPMVRALLEDRKRQTRRLAWRRKVYCDLGDGIRDEEDVMSPWQKVKPGDRLWVRENAILGNKVVARYHADGEGNTLSSCDWAEVYGRGYPQSCRDYASSGLDCCRESARAHPWTPSIHMPRWASRLTLLVEAVKVERLQDISEEDAIAEGIARNPVQQGTWIDYPEGTSAAGWESPIRSFRSLWNSLHGDDAWANNPELVCLSFKVVKANIDSLKDAA